MNIGMVGMHGCYTSNRAVADCDVLIAVGTRFSDRVALNPKTFAKNATIIQIDIDPSELGKNVEVDLSMQSQGFRIFASVGTSSFSYVKPDISAVICDRLHPDGTTLRHSRSRYLQFYNAEDIMDTQVRPDLGVDW